MKMDDAKLPKLVIFDLDGTLTESKSNIDDATARLLAELLQKIRVAVISGAWMPQYRRQFLSRFHIPPALLKNLFLFPTNSTVFYCYDRGWNIVYEYKLAKEEKEKILKAFRDAFRKVGYVPPKKTYGKVIEDRLTQVSFSALGQDVVRRLGARGIEMKAAWGKLPWRKKIARELKKHLPEFSVRLGGLSTIDITRKGIDKAYGVRKILKELGVKKSESLFIGDALYPGGNDEPAKRTGVRCIQVSGPKETKKLIRKFLGQR